MKQFVPYRNSVLDTRMIMLKGESAVWGKMLSAPAMKMGRDAEGRERAFTKMVFDLMPRGVSRRIVFGGAAVWWTASGAPAHAARNPAIPPLILVDAGHGGNDPGAVGTGGTLEKSVTLANALAVRAALEKSGRFRVELTRAVDRYVSPERRADLAREYRADLFLSLHADTDPAASVRGAAVYTLASRASDAATAALADRENGEMRDGSARRDDMPPEVSQILSSLASRQTRAESARVAHQLVRDLERDLPVLPMPERHANFIVLRASGIPSVLIEMGFLSNPEEEAALAHPDHQVRIAQAVTRSVSAWFGPKAG